jgi:uncharacterized membrane protein
VTTPARESQDRRPNGIPAREADDPEVEASAAGRVIFFSDAVVAIAITLLALALPVPHTTASTTSGQFLGELGDDRAAYFAFLLSFVVIGSNWAAHRRVFRYAIRTNDQVYALNMVWLLMMILTPFAARVLSGHGAFGVRFTIYVLIQVVATTCLLQLSGALRRGGLLRPDAPASARHPDNVHNLALIAMFLVSIPVAFVTGWAFALWGAAPLITRVLQQAPDNYGRHNRQPRWSRFLQP